MRNVVATHNPVTRIKPADGTLIPMGELMERIIAAGDISQLDPIDRAHYLVRVAESAGLNPLSQPFDLIAGRDGTLVLYANKKATDQLRKLYGLTSRIVSRTEMEGVYVVEVEVSDGRRTETNIGAVPIAGLRGEALANALMRTITKAKRRATLDFAGLGVLDETEIEGLRGALGERPRAEVVDQAADDGEDAGEAPALGDGIAEAEIVDPLTGEIWDAETEAMWARLVANAVISDTATSLNEVKRQVQQLVRYAEWSDEDLALAAGELALPGWRALTLADAVTLRDEIVRRLAHAEAQREAQIAQAIGAEAGPA